MAYVSVVKIIETHVFTRQVKDILSDEEYRLLQNTLVLRPDMGKIIRGSGGLRKIRWTGSGRGKRGGTRIIYYWMKTDDTILMLLIYKKQASDDLSKEQLKILRKLVEEEIA